MNQEQKFSIIPEADELAALDRDLRFFPATNSRHEALTVSQVDQYNDLGYVSGVTIYSPDEMTKQRAYFDRLLEEAQARGDDSYSISSAHLTYAGVYDILTHPKIVACVRDLLGENVIGWGSHYFCKMPGDGKSVAWHQDASYWPLTPSKTVTVWLAIDRADRENACVRFIPGSHRSGHIDYVASDESEGNVLDQTVVDIDQYGEPIDVELEAGQISLHSDLLLHGSEANSSPRRRCGLTLRYCTPDVTAHLDWNRKGVVVSGSDPTGHWANPPRPSEST